MIISAPVNSDRKIRLPRVIQAILMDIPNNRFAEWWTYNGIVALSSGMHPIKADGWEKVGTSKLFKDGRYIHVPKGAPDHMLRHIEPEDPLTIQDRFTALSDVDVEEDELVAAFTDATPSYVEEDNVRAVLNREVRPRVFFLAACPLVSFTYPRVFVLTRPQFRQLLSVPGAVLVRDHEMVGDVLLHHMERGAG